MGGACGRNVAGTGLLLAVSGAGSYLCVVFLIWLLGGWLCTCRQIQEFHGFSSNFLISRDSESFVCMCVCVCVCVWAGPTRRRECRGAKFW